MFHLQSAGLLPTSARSLAPMRLWRPASVQAALGCLAQCDEPVLLAGGTDLVAQYNEGLSPRSLVDLSRIDALRQLHHDDGVLRIGALVTHDRGAGDALVRTRLPGFARAWSRIANPRIRFRATLGGNLMARRTRYEGALLLQALQAQLHFASVDGMQRIGVDAIWHGSVPERAVLTTIEIDGTLLLAFDYERSLRPLMTQALAVWRQPQGLRLTLALGTENLAPVDLSLAVPGLTTLQQLRQRSSAIAHDLLAGLPDTFADTQVTSAYARRAGAALLARQLESLHA